MESGLRILHVQEYQHTFVLEIDKSNNKTSINNFNGYIY